MCTPVSPVDDGLSPPTDTCAGARRPRIAER
jgi:hypothetical protein